jgi:hypothetical protein
MNSQKLENTDESYASIRKTTGFLGLTIPIICVLGGSLFGHYPVQPTISYYYYTNMQNYFVMVLACVSLILMCYKGYKLIDTIVTNATGIAGFGIAFFPCITKDSVKRPIGIFQLNPYLSNVIHLSFASIFFVLIAINSIFLFTKTDHRHAVDKRNIKIRNSIYVSSGLAIIACLITIVCLTAALGPTRINDSRIGILLETIMLVCFSVSWLVKGEILFKDRIFKLK